ncbi:NADH-flavin reductase [Sphaerisporangium krabiense]|uniref:Putative NADH-flavin reductase n=1 Tax=Sphaerisporangium krabiense TaxID=763782 RepID=A0A7W9DNQ0_9ACTN|nr:SDR family oxidoreductase [Sphaerisporangium krabiense]MBB5625671.1 putative NADH-flavin reductase [Sphaerisporangium krabiense]GII62993.1 NADH-flavin reductase [Sphaerisporangium krabiense]
MRLTVVGATGGVGKEVVRQALDAGHQVAAVVRDPARLPISHSALEVVTADVTAPEALRPALAGREAVISALGPRTRKDAGIAAIALRSVIRAMETMDVRRLVVISAAPLGPTPEDDGLLYRAVLRPLIRRFLRDVYADLAVMEDEVRRSATEWTIVRPPRLTDKPLTGAYRRVIGGSVPRGYTISRADTAHAMLTALDDPATLKQAVGVAN